MEICTVFMYYIYVGLVFNNIEVVLIRLRMIKFLSLSVKFLAFE